MNTNFPLILVFGREPNSNESLVEAPVGRYCFTCTPKSSFWNRAYRTVARVTDYDSKTDGKKFKDDCIAYNISPILFANVSPVPILASHQNKEKTRNSIPDEKFHQQARLIFSHALLKNRLRAVIISVESESLSQAKAITTKYCPKGIPILDIPYFARNISNHDLMQAVKVEDNNQSLERLERTIREFEEHCAQLKQIEF